MKMTHEYAVHIVVGVAAHWTLSTACTDAQIAQVIGVFLVIHWQTHAELASPTVSLLHHFREGFASSSLSVVLLELELLYLHHALDYVLLTLPSTTLPVVQVLKIKDYFCNHKKKLFEGFHLFLLLLLSIYF